MTKKEYYLNKPFKNSFYRLREIPIYNVRVKTLKACDWLILSLHLQCQYKLALSINGCCPASQNSTSTNWKVDRNGAFLDQGRFSLQMIQGL